jgi:hypothetical protein
MAKGREGCELATADCSHLEVRHNIRGEANWLMTADKADKQRSVKQTNCWVLAAGLLSAGEHSPA